MPEAALKGGEWHRTCEKVHADPIDSAGRQVQSLFSLEEIRKQPFPFLLGG